jgi:hypothetical protein
MARVLWHVTMSLDGFIGPPKDSSVTFLSGDITRAIESASVTNLRLWYVG